MSFVFTHDQMIEEGQALGENALAPMRAVIVGGNAQIFSPDGNPDRTGVGVYNGNAIGFHYPNMSADALVDLSSVRARAAKALLQYYSGDARVIGDQPNQICVAADVAGTRGVRVGDTVRISGRSAEIMAIVADEAEKVLILSRNLSAEQRAEGEVPINLCLEIYDVDFEDAEISGTFVTLPANIKMLTTDWAPNGIPGALPVVSADIHIEYTVWYSSLADCVRVAEVEEDLDYIPGDDIAANDLKKAVSLAFKNSGGMPVAYIAVADPTDLDSWVAALNKVRSDYGIVPCSDDPAVLAAVEDLVEHRSRAESGSECVAWVPLRAPLTAVVADETNSEDFETLLAVVTQSADGQVVEVPEGNARFMSLGVRPGDVLRYGANVYEEYVIAAVVNEDAITVQGDVLDHSIPEKIEIWRKLDNDDLADYIANKAAAYQNKRIRAVWSNELSDGHEILAGWHLCAALAGLRSGCAPHRDLTGVTLAGITANSRVDLFDDDQLDMMAECGVWLVVGAGAVATRRGFTTADHSDITAYSEAVVTNLDTINKALRATLSRALRSTAGTKRFRSRIVQQLRTKLNDLAGRRAATIGAQLVAGEIDVVRRHVYLEDSLVLNVKLTIPRSVGYDLGTPTMEVHQRVIA